MIRPGLFDPVGNSPERLFLQHHRAEGAPYGADVVGRHGLAHDAAHVVLAQDSRVELVHRSIGPLHEAVAGARVGAQAPRIAP